MAKKVEGRHGGYLLARQKGEPPSPRSGRPKNIFKETIRLMAESDSAEMELVGLLVDENGAVTDQQVRVLVKFPVVEAVVRKMYKKAAKGDVPAARWLSETAYGKNLNLGEDEENPMPSGFSFVIEDRRGGGVED